MPSSDSARSTVDSLRAYLDELEARRAELAALTEQARPELLGHQTPPEHADGWLLTGGRGVGKTYAGSRWIGDLARTVPGLRGRIITPTLSDAVNGVVNDPDSGILAHDKTAVLKTSGPEGVRVVWPNGSTVWCVGTPTPRDVDRLRALTNIDADLFEEAAANPQLSSVVDQANLSRRGKRLARPVWAATTTPRPLPQIKTWLEDPLVAVTRATTFDNPHTPEAYRLRAERLKGTRLYKQEVLGELLEDVEGALWTLADIERSMIPVKDRAELVAGLSKLAVGVDPPAGDGTCGIVVVGRDDAGHLYVLDDYSISNPTPHQWAMRAATASADYGALVVAEKNMGGRMVEAVLRQAVPNLPITTVSASQGKKTRAEPIAIRWEAEIQSAHMAPASEGDLSELIDQMTTWVPGEFSPDRVDALVWAGTYLLDSHKAVMHTGSISPSRATPTTLGAALRGGF